MKLYQEIYDSLRLLEGETSKKEELLSQIKEKISRLEESKRIIALLEVYQKNPSDQNLTTLLMHFERKLQIALKDEDFLKISSEGSLAEKQELPSIFVLDSLRSAWNIGSIIRSAAAFGFQEVRLYGYSSGLENAKVRKAALGSEEYLKVEPISKKDFLSLKEEGYIFYGLETDSNAKKIHTAQINKKAVFIFGNERFGISKDLREILDDYLYIPMLGKKQSLNVASAAAITAYEYARQYGKF